VKKNSKLPGGTDDLLEPFLDEGARRIGNQIFKAGLPELAEETPILKWGKLGYDMYSMHKMNKLSKRMAAFLSALEADAFKLRQFEELDESLQAMVIEILINELDLQNDNYQAEALALLFNAYIKKEIDRLMFQGVAHELKNANPLTFYFNVDSLVVNNDQDRLRIISGPINYLPAAFVSGSNDQFESTSDNLLTNLGKTFYEVIYVPMQQRYSI
jgi:hypothetical protein